jgi:hypothetical protein
MGSRLTQAQEKIVPQKYLVLDKYSLNRIYLAEGDAIRFRLKGEKTIFNDHIEELNDKDSTIFLAGAKIGIPTQEFAQFYFDRKWLNFMRAGLGFIGGGFLFSAAVHPLIGQNANYEPKEQAIIGASALVLGQTTRFFRTKRFKINKNSRIRILDMR